MPFVLANNRFFVLFLCFHKRPLSLCVYLFAKDNLFKVLVFDEVSPYLWTQYTTEVWTLQNALRLPFQRISGERFGFSLVSSRRII